MIEGIIVVRPFLVRYGERRYRGFDGEIWPGASDEVVEKFLFTPDQVSLAKSIASNAGEGANTLYVSSKPYSTSVLPDFNFIGFDVGVLQSSFNVFSFIIQEPALGKDEFLEDTNANLLFSNHERARQFLEFRQSVVIGDKEFVTAGDLPDVFAVYCE